jgi:alpha-beta hydrolase superfamily lysophospholipase
MQETSFLVDGRDGAVFVRRWNADGTAPASARATIQIAHGMGEHSARYARFGAALTDAGYVVYASDHPGHGETAAANGAALGHFGTDGWNGLIDDTLRVGAYADGETGDLPRVLFGHSMGSFALQQLLLDHAETLAGAVLSGTSAVDGIAAALPAEGDEPMSLTVFNAPFEPARTEFDWLSRDPAEVDKYIADPWCGFGVDMEGLRDMAADAARMGDPDALRGIRSDLPLLMISGLADPLAGGGMMVDLVAQRYRDAGLQCVTTKWYEGARHELLNETNRDEVTRDVLAWLDDVV